jgi:hypothetical protein
MKSLFSFGIILATLLITSCGGSGDTILNPGGGPLGISEAASIQLIASSPQLQSDQFGLATVTITAIAKDVNNNVISGIPIVFSADNNGSLLIDPIAVPFTSGAGLATAELSNSVGDARNRTINVSATDGNVVATISINVVGTSLTISGPAALAQNDSAPYTIILADAGGVGIFSENVTVTSANGNAINPASMNLTTGVDGDATFTLTATQPGDDTITVTGLGLTAARVVSVSGDSFTIAVPDAVNGELTLSPPMTSDHAVTATWLINNVAQANQQINFATTRGTLSVGSAMTNAAGVATVMIGSTNAGPAQITAEIDSTGTTTGFPLEFVATNPASMTLQASPTTVAINEQSEISATVRDAAFNLVKNQTVEFVVTADDSNGQLLAGTAVTDSQGRATVFYRGGGVSGTPDGVTIQATVRGSAPLVQGSVNLTVARKELDLVIGTGNEIFEPTTASFAQEWNVIVTDAVGNAVANSIVQVSIRSTNYYEGDLDVITPASGGQSWGFLTAAQVCPDEDFVGNRNGSLDLVNGVVGTGEDANGSGQLEAGNVAVVAAVPPGASTALPCASAGATGTSADVTTNDQGIARVCVTWPQDHSWWVDTRIEARATASGSEFSSQQVFLLPALAEDINDISTAPPNINSPYGTDRICATPPPGLPFP